MPGDVRGTAVKVLGYTETAFKTPGPDGNVLYFTQNTVVPSRELVQSQTLAGRRGQSKPVDGNKDVAGAITQEVGPEDIGWTLKHLIGAPTTTGAGPYVHTFKPAISGANALPPGFTLETDYTANMTGTARYLQQKGLRFGDATLTINPSGYIMLAANVMGSTWLQAAAPLDATPTDTGHKGFSAAEVAVTIGALGFEKNICLSTMTLNVNNDLDGDKRCIGNGGERDGMPEGFFITGGSMTAFLDHEDVINTVLTGAVTEMKIVIMRGTGAGTVGNEKLTITLGDIQFAVTAPGIDGPRGLKVQANFSGFQEGVVEIDTTWVLNNAVATIS